MSSLKESSRITSEHRFSRIDSDQSPSRDVGKGSDAVYSEISPRPTLRAAEERLPASPQPVYCEDVEKNKEHSTENNECLLGNTSASCKSSLIQEMFTSSQIPPGMLAMRQALDAELELQFHDEGFESLPSVTHLWNQKIYVGGLPDIECLTKLRGLGITHMINCCAGEWPTPQELKSEFTVAEFDTTDQIGYPILLHHYNAFASTLDFFLMDPNAKVFVHCISGINRSVCLCAAYLMSMLQLTPLEVVRFFHENGKDRVLQNISFRDCLVRFFFSSRDVLPRVSEKVSK